MKQEETAIVVGVGPGLGMAIVRTCAQAGMNVVAASRNVEKLGALTGDLGDAVRAIACDATREEPVRDLFEATTTAFGSPDLVVFNAGAFVPKGLLETDVAEFERCWRVGCLGGFLVGREAARSMLAMNGAGGTIIFTGATASLRGGAGFHNLAVGKFGLRALAQSMAREFGPRGIHVAHVIIDGQIQAEERDGYREDKRAVEAVLQPNAIAGNYLALHRQPRNAWTQELDLRPWVEKF